MSSIDFFASSSASKRTSQPELPSAHLPSPWGVLQACRRSTLPTLECIETNFRSQSCQALICLPFRECCNHVLINFLIRLMYRDALFRGQSCQALMWIPLGSAATMSSIGFFTRSSASIRTSRPNLPSARLPYPWGVLQPCRRSISHKLECIKNALHSQSCQALICILLGECCNHVVDPLFIRSSVSRRAYLGLEPQWPQDFDNMKRQ